MIQRLLAVLALCATAAFAADITGTWKGSGQSPLGTIDRIFHFKQDGTKLTGDTSSSAFGNAAISNGKVEGDTVTFSLNLEYEGQAFTVNYNGKINGNEIKFTAEAAGTTFSFTARKE